MAHRFKNPEILVPTAIGVLDRDRALLSVVWRDGEAFYSGRSGDTIHIRRPGRTTAKNLAWRDPARKIETSPLNEGSLDVKLDAYPYVAVDLLDEELSLDVEPYAERVLGPMTIAVGEDIEDRISALITSATYKETITPEPTAERPIYKMIVQGSKFLNDHHVPKFGRRALIGSAVEARLLDEKIIVQADQSGSSNALREGQIGRVNGYELISTSSIPENDAYLFHETAYAAVLRAPNPARGVAYSSSMSVDGIALTYWEDYNSENASDRAFLGTFMGARVITDPVDKTDPDGNQEFVRAVKLTLDTTP